MTDAETKMKKYTNAVKRRLSLSKDVRERIMGDFVSSIQARRLADPVQAAADLWDAAGYAGFYIFSQ